jgi:hypothetical protein
MDTTKLPRFEAGGKVVLKRGGSSSSNPPHKGGPSPMSKMEFICGGKALVCLDLDGSVSVTDLEHLSTSPSSSQSAGQIIRYVLYIHRYIY